MKPVCVIIVHGIATSDTRESIGRLDADFEAAGVRSVRWSYPYVHALMTRFGNEDRARGFLTFCEDMAKDYTIVLVVHSNGARLANDAAWMADADGVDCPFEHVVMISPALDRDTELAPGIKKCDVFYTRHDWAVVFGSLLLFHKFGLMGRLGPDSDDPRYRRRVNGSAEIRGHGDWWTAHGRKFLRMWLIAYLVKEYGAAPRAPLVDNWSTP